MKAIAEKIAKIGAWAAARLARPCGMLRDWAAGHRLPAAAGLCLGLLVR